MERYSTVQWHRKQNHYSGSTSTSKTQRVSDYLVRHSSNISHPTERLRRILHTVIVLSVLISRWKLVMMPISFIMTHLCWKVVFVLGMEPIVCTNMCYQTLHNISQSEQLLEISQQYASNIKYKMAKAVLLNNFTTHFMIFSNRPFLFTNSNLRPLSIGCFEEFHGSPDD